MVFDRIVLLHQLVQLKTVLDLRHHMAALASKLDDMGSDAVLVVPYRSGVQIRNILLSKAESNIAQAKTIDMSLETNPLVENAQRDLKQYQQTDVHGIYLVDHDDATPLSGKEFAKSLKTMLDKA